MLWGLAAICQCRKRRHPERALGLPSLHIRPCTPGHAPRSCTPSHARYVRAAIVGWARPHLFHHVPPVSCTNQRRRDGHAKDFAFLLTNSLRPAMLCEGSGELGRRVDVAAAEISQEPCPKNKSCPWRPSDAAARDGGWAASGGANPRLGLLQRPSPSWRIA
jgi:hypothetical protein